ncbi:MAG: hypothetical protein ACD_78C00274G0005 [uncultured bacterium (gcode 4)]|uniref:Uncharacterized protein n=1 Tax=uncultured bacterium (gcode 4) TaxID=1234023 RepID=K1YBR8_9BACT|nr:MAG: hypothetical protein ACD_78C00274G0005 [uncultured bacterium (gcode 4)]
MSSYIKSFGKSVWARWGEELNNFMNSRKELLYVREFQIAIFLTLVPLLLSPLFLFVPEGSGFMVLIILLITISVYTWLVGLWFITVGSALFDNIPVFSDISGIVDGIDGLGANKVRHVSTILKKKEYLENRLTEWMRWILIFLTIRLFGKSKRMMKESFVRIFRFGQIWDGLSRIFVAMLISTIPVCTITGIGLFGILANLRPSIARLPLLLMALVYTIMIISLITSFHGPVVAILAVPLIFGGYTFFFAEKEELLMVRGIFRYIREEVRYE